MTHRREEGPEASALWLHVRRELAEELSMHDYRPGSHACLCGDWDPEDSWWEHLATSALSIIYGEP